MRSKFVTDSQDPSDGFLSPAGAELNASFLPWIDPKGADPFGKAADPLGSGAVKIPSTALASEAVISSAAQTGAITVTSMTAGGITINLLFDAAAMAAPASFRAGIQQAASLLTAAISDKITVNIKIDYSGTGGGAFAGPDGGYYESYSSVRADLINNATQGDTTFSSLPTGSLFQGQSNVAVWNAQLKLFGILGANDTTTDDGSATFATDINSNLLVGVALHELTHAMGRVPYGPPTPPEGPEPDIFDLFRFTSAGNPLIAGGNTAPAAYFSLDGGNTKLADYGRNSDPSDFLNSGVQGSSDPFNEFYNGGTIQTLTAADKQQLDALGFHTLTPVTTVIEAIGSTSLVQVGQNYFFDSISSGTGPELKYQAAPVVAGQFGALAPIGAEAAGTGYEVAWKVPGADQYAVWYTDNNGNFLSTTGTVSGTSSTLESFESSFHQDLNGDGVIGVPTTVVIEALGSTRLVEVGSNYFLDSISSGTGPSLKFGGVAYVAGQYGAWAPIGAEATATGYEVAWKLAGADQYTVWYTDNNGNFVSNAVALATGTGLATGTSLALESFETSFHQDLNGDGFIGVPTTAITLPSANVSASAGQALQSSSLFSASDSNGDTLTYYLYDNTVATTGGHFALNGTALPNDAMNAVTAAQLAQVTFVAGAAGASDDLYVKVYDGHVYTNWSEFHVSVPVVTVPSANVSASAGQALQASSLFSGSDLDGDTLTYYLYNNTVATTGGHFALNGTALPNDTMNPVTAAQLAQVTFVAGAAGTSDDLYVKLYDGHVYTDWSEFHVSVPKVTVPSANVSASAGHALQATSLFSGSDLDGDTLTYYLYDNTVATTGGHFALNGTALPNDTMNPVTAAQLAQATFVAGAVGTSDDLYVKVYDGHVYTNWSEFHVNVNSAPVILDLDGNGINLSLLGASKATFDMTGDGQRVHTAWASAGDGFLAIDLGANGKAGPDGVIDQSKEIVFTEWAPGTTSDMQALRQVFDTNHDGKLDSGDAHWSDFRIWQDANGNGISDPGEVKTLDQLGIVSIDLNPAGPAKTLSDGSVIQGLASFARADGTVGIAADVSLAHGQSSSGSQHDAFEQSFRFGSAAGGAETFKWDFAPNGSHPAFVGQELTAPFQPLPHDSPLAAVDSSATAHTDVGWHDAHGGGFLSKGQPGSTPWNPDPGVIPHEWHIV